MQLVNHTPVVADLRVMPMAGLSRRVGLLTAKATFRFSEGHTELDSQQPYGLLQADEPTELGLLPRDIHLWFHTFSHRSHHRRLLLRCLLHISIFPCQSIGPRVWRSV